MARGHVETVLKKRKYNIFIYKSFNIRNKKKKKKKDKVVYIYFLLSSLRRFFFFFVMLKCMKQEKKQYTVCLIRACWSELLFENSIKDENFERASRRALPLRRIIQTISIIVKTLDPSRGPKISESSLVSNERKKMTKHQTGHYNHQTQI